MLLDTLVTYDPGCSHLSHYLAISDLNGEQYKS